MQITATYINALPEQGCISTLKGMAARIVAMDPAEVEKLDGGALSRIGAALEEGSFDNWHGISAAGLNAIPESGCILVLKKLGPAILKMSPEEVGKLGGEALGRIGAALAEGSFDNWRGISAAGLNAIPEFGCHIVFKNLSAAIHAMDPAEKAQLSAETQERITRSCLPARPGNGAGASAPGPSPKG